MKKIAAILLCFMLLSVIIGCGTNVNREAPVFETENVSGISFKSSASDWIEVPSGDLPAIVAWLGTFRAGEKASPPYIPGTNGVTVRIEYSDGHVTENGLGTIRIDGSDYYMTNEDTPEEYLELGESLYPKIN